MGNKEEEVLMPSQFERKNSFDSVSKKSFHSIILVIFTRPECGTSQKRTKIAYKTDTDSGGILMSFRVLKILYPRSTMAE